MPDVAGDYILGLVVNDGAVDSAVDRVSLTVVAAGANRAPVANAGIDQNVSTGTTVTLDGSASADPDGNLITYAWTVDSRPAGSAAAIADATSPRPSLAADKSGTYTISLVVSDGVLASVADQVVVTASAGNSAPVADAGPDQNVLVGATVELDGSGSTRRRRRPAELRLEHRRQAGGQRRAAGVRRAATTTIRRRRFVADVPGVYVISLVVGDGKAFSTPVVRDASTAASGQRGACRERGRRRVDGRRARHGDPERRR